MEKYTFAKPLIILFVIIVSIVLTLFILSNYRMQNLCIYETYKGNYVTIWKNDYIIFEKYEGRKPPKDNYIKLNHDAPYRGDVDVFFKTNDSILIYNRCGFDNLIDVVFDKNVHKVEVFFATREDRQEFMRRTSYQDSLVAVEYFFYEDRGVLWPTFNECVGDSMYIREYPVDRKHFFFFMMDLYDYNDSVFYRYDERFNNRAF